LYKQEGKTQVPSAVAVKALGFSSLNGASKVRLAAMRQYGLIEGKENQVRVSSRGLALSLRSSDTREFQEARAQAALTPSTFRELYTSKREASDEALRHHLIAERGFSQDGAKRLIAVYRSAMQFAPQESELDGRVAESNDSSDGVEALRPAVGADSPVGGRGVAGFPSKLSTDRSSLINTSNGAIVPQIHFNIQVQIPENATPEAYDAIFKSIATHLLGRGD